MSDMSDIGENDAEGRRSRRSLGAAQRRVDGEIILLWTLPVTVILWGACFFLFPGFNPPMSPTMSAKQVAEFYRDPAHLPQIRYSMIIFNWFGVCLVPILTLIVMQIRRMAHRTPIFSYAMLGCVAGGPTLFLIANVCWLLAAFRPERSRSRSAAQRFRLDHLHDPGPLSDRAKRRNECTRARTHNVHVYTRPNFVCVYASQLCVWIRVPSCVYGYASQLCVWIRVPT